MNDNYISGQLPINSRFMLADNGKMVIVQLLKALIVLVWRGSWCIIAV